jgi:hypothetical protein
MVVVSLLPRDRALKTDKDSSKRQNAAIRLGELGCYSRTEVVAIAAAR